MKKLLLIALIFTGCKEAKITENKKDIYFGTCKVKVLDTKGNYIGQQYLIYNEEIDPSLQLEFVDSCNTVGGLYVNENDSSGRMCYTCIPQMFFPK